MAAPDTLFFASTTNIVRIVVLTVSTVGNTIFNRVERLWQRARDWLREPMLPRIECPPVLRPVADLFVVERSAAPVATFEPEFVGAGPMLRRWR